jgi:uncharacterized membrane protein
VPWPSRNPEDYRGSGGPGPPRSVRLRRAAWILAALSIPLAALAMYYGMAASAESEPNVDAARTGDVVSSCAIVAVLLSALLGIWSAVERNRGR